MKELDLPELGVQRQTPAAAGAFTDAEGFSVTIICCTWLFSALGLLRCVTPITKFFLCKRSLMGSLKWWWETEWHKQGVTFKNQSWICFFLIPLKGLGCETVSFLKDTGIQQLGRATPFQTNASWISLAFNSYISPYILQLPHSKIWRNIFSSRLSARQIYPDFYIKSIRAGEQKYSNWSK